MNAKEFEDLIDRQGEDMSAWPAAQRQAAECLLATSPEAQAVLDEARALRAALAAPAVRAPPGLAERISAAARRLKITAPPREQVSAEADVAAASVERTRSTTEESA